MIKHWTESVGIVAFGAYIPLGSDRDEDVGSYCLNTVANIKGNFPKIDMSRIGAAYVGSESFPYAVKPMVSLIAEQIAMPAARQGTFEVAGADLQFACKAGTAGMRMAALEVATESATYALAIGADISQAKPGDVLEKTVGKGAGGLVMGIKRSEMVAQLQWMGSVASDTPDFWRRAGEEYPEHAGRFTGGPSYLNHVAAMTEKMLMAAKTKPTDFDFVVLHSPNVKYPDMIAEKFGFRSEALVHRILFPRVKNAYAGSSMIGLNYALETALPRQKILVVSYGSGAGSDGFIFEITNKITQKVKFSLKYQL